MIKKILLSGIIITCIWQAQASASSVAGTVEKGNRLYHGQQYEDASKCYDQALAQQPDSAIINFDAGTAQYKTKEYQKANSSFEQSLTTEDKGLEAKANYNLGNSKYMLGLSKENTELSIAVQLLEGALNNYTRAQELTPKDEDVKVNYKIVQEKLKELKEKLKQQPQEDRKQRTEDGKQNQEKKEAEGQQAQQEQQKTEDKELKNEKTEELKNESSREQEQSALAQPPEPKEMSKEEANMLLEGYRQEENATGMLKDDRKGTEEKVLKDW
ncbi:MAG: tetratricopeptide repeat protein [Candidatus Omnitrophica bacterium]|nr:tetratricopeptide repeat protein [Candidatus Omnitrophota bacterium]MBU4303805.1 tetratricopeptide repeat protein [Candidatus Omnitrophota bacterium]MBU4418492.1 tetratricopeptide repeat protein [Candidatus Omnitrophota bacterium]MBU4467996.1 tetratricopeptide repeat protein [Candidatus Omnitrophota bacterium]MCG2707793.1 tetratricopeptide repeat protein [Candidatus Omnitrophota bacterium]